MIKRLIIAVILLGLVVGGIVGFNLFRDKMIGQFFANRQPEPVAVSTVAVEPGTWTPGVEAIGTARAKQGVELGVETPGIVKQIRFQANDEVEAGEILVQLDDAIEQADLAAANATLNLSETQLKRQQTLQARGVTAANDLDEAQASATSARAEVEKLTAVMRQKALRAPFAGTIGIPQVDVGQYLAAGTVYATLQDLDSMRVDFSIPEQQGRIVRIGMPVVATSEVGDISLRGQVIGIEPRIDPNSRLVTVRAEIEDPGHSLNPGQFLRVRVELPAEEGVISLPQTAVNSTLYGDGVYVVQEEGEGDQKKTTVEQVFVQVGRRSLGRVEVTSGLSPGDVVVTAGQNRLFTGAPVKIDNTINPADAEFRAIGQ
ncbi:efflux RND transporter periplasmic adaptor subunit [Amaricoccus solimangrovi]|uniref:Efflux RND transporter periplasmic adaptor subunit n=1 Tax=Amaricoccus solimangrovi TaxID=2589815 RepID=A0A501WU26_9RHOB|nr:efflux RND transporter periplasmic adaptor subunit [Amaricoccus solimangrovi]TPE52232.1 efflux RND transporter periplasmic adaptor subunit [Amaricoccus solimangrovi]